MFLKDIRFKRWDFYFIVYRRKTGCGLQTVSLKTNWENLFPIFLFTGMVFGSASPWQQTLHCSPLRLFWRPHFFWLPWPSSWLGFKCCAAPKVCELVCRVWKCVKITCSSPFLQASSTTLSSLFYFSLKLTTLWVSIRVPSLIKKWVLINSSHYSSKPLLNYWQITHLLDAVSTFRFAES